MRTRTIALYTLGGLSLALATGCANGPTTVADCVKQGTKEVVDDKYCSRSGGGGVYIFSGSTYTDTRTGRTMVKGGSYRAPANTNISSRSGTTIRSGFGGGSHGGSGS